MLAWLFWTGIYEILPKTVGRVKVFTCICICRSGAQASQQLILEAERAIREKLQPLLDKAEQISAGQGTAETSMRRQSLRHRLSGQAMQSVGFLPLIGLHYLRISHKEILSFDTFVHCSGCVGHAKTC